MMSLARLVPLGVLALVMPAVALAEGPAKKTGAECIAIALAEQPTLKAASASVEAARERVWESTAAYLPQVGASYSATRRHASAGSLTGSNFGGARAATFDLYRRADVAHQRRGEPGPGGGQLPHGAGVPRAGDRAPVLGGVSR